MQKTAEGLIVDNTEQLIAMVRMVREVMGDDHPLIAPQPSPRSGEDDVRYNLLGLLDTTKDFQPVQYAFVGEERQVLEGCVTSVAGWRQRNNIDHQLAKQMKQEISPPIEQPQGSRHPFASRRRFARLALSHS